MLNDAAVADTEDIAMARLRSSGSMVLCTRMKTRSPKLPYCEMLTLAWGGLGEAADEMADKDTSATGHVRAVLDMAGRHDPVGRGDVMPGEEVQMELMDPSRIGLLLLEIPRLRDGIRWRQWWCVGLCRMQRHAGTDTDEQSQDSRQTWRHGFTP